MVFMSVIYNTPVGEQRAALSVSLSLCYSSCRQMDVNSPWIMFIPFSLNVGILSLITSKAYCLLAVTVKYVLRYSLFVIGVCQTRWFTVNINLATASTWLWNDDIADNNLARKHDFCSIVIFCGICFELYE